MKRLTELELDAGNTFVKWRIRRHGALETLVRWRTQDFRNGLIAFPKCWQGLDRARYVSVAGAEVNQRLNLMFEQHGVPYQQARVHAEQQGLKNAYQQPDQMGADRWLAMLAGWKVYQNSVCVIDAGSAITIDWVAANGQHIGGYILPGLAMLKKSLLGQTAEVRWQQHESEMAQTVPGHNTAQCVEHGCHYQLSALMGQIGLDCQRQSISTIVLTGGDAALLLPWCEDAIVHPTLVMDGLVYLES